MIRPSQKETRRRQEIRKKLKKQARIAAREGRGAERHGRAIARIWLVLLRTDGEAETACHVSIRI